MSCTLSFHTWHQIFIIIYHYYCCYLLLLLLLSIIIVIYHYYHFIIIPGIRLSTGKKELHCWVVFQSTFYTASITVYYTPSIRNYIMVYQSTFYTVYLLELLFAS